MVQVNYPKKKNTYCQKCKKHTSMSVSVYKATKGSKLAQGQRRYERKQKGFGGQTKPVFHKKAKTTKKTVIKMKCGDCARICQKPLKRAKTFILLSEAQLKDKRAAEPNY